MRSLSYVRQSKEHDFEVEYINLNSYTTKQNGDYPPTLDEQEKIRDESNSSSGRVENEAYFNYSTSHY